MRTQKAVLTGLVMMATACASTQMSTTWRNPTYSGALPRKVLVVAFVPNQATRQQVQDQLANKLSEQRIQAVPVSRLSPAGEPKTQEELGQLIREGGFDGLVVARYKKTTEDVNVSPVYGAGWGGYIGAYGPYGAGYWATPMEQMETSLFETRNGGKLIWSGTSNTTVSAANGTAISNQDIAHYAAVIVGRMNQDVSGQRG